MDVPLLSPPSLSIYISIYIVVGSSSGDAEAHNCQWFRVPASCLQTACSAVRGYSWLFGQATGHSSPEVTETQDSIPPAHMRAVDAHYDSMSKREQRKARAAGFRPYRELPRSGDTVMELNEARACWRLRQDDGEDATSRRQTYTRHEMLAVMRVLLDSIGSRRCTYLRGQSEVIRIGLGLGSRYSYRRIAKMLGLSAVSSVHEQISSFRRKWEAGMRKARRTRE